MGNHAALIRQQNAGRAVTRRGTRFLEFDLGGGRRRFVATIEPLHVRNSETEIDATWTPDSGAWQWKIAAADYQFHARSVFNVGNLVEWRVGDEWVVFDPQSINWINQDNSRQQIAIKQAVKGLADDATLRFPAAYGAGRHFEYVAHPSRLMKHIIIDSFEALPAPTVTGTVWFEAEFTLATSAGVDLYLDGVRWAKTNNIRVRTGNRIAFRAVTSGAVLWYAAKPVATDAKGETASAEYEVRRSGGTYFVTVRVPRAWLQAATYPVVVDPTLDVQPDATAGIDTYVYRDLPTTPNGSAATMNLAAAGAYHRQGLIRFDLSGLEGAAELTSGTLTLYVTTTYEWDPQPIHLHRILAANSGWSESSTWAYAVPSTVRWAGDAGSDGGEDAGCTVSGTDYDATPMGSRTIPANAAVGSAQAVTLDLTEFAEMISANYGLVVEPTSYAPFAVGSSDNATTGYRPRLVVEYTEGGGSTDELSTSGLTTGAPVLGTPALEQAHVLTAAGWATGAPALDSPTLEQAHVLGTSGLVASAAIVETPALEQVHSLTTTGLSAGDPALEAPALGQAHALTAEGLVTGAPALDKPTLGTEGVHILGVSGLTTGVPVLDAPTLEQVHALGTAGAVAETPMLDNPILAHIWNLETGGLALPAPVLDAPTIGQVHVLGMVGLAAGLPVLDAPALGQHQGLGTGGLLGGVPVFDAPVLRMILPTARGHVTVHDAASYGATVSDAARYGAAVQDAARYGVTVRDE